MKNQTVIDFHADIYTFESQFHLIKADLIRQRENPLVGLSLLPTYLFRLGASPSTPDEVHLKHALLVVQGVVWAMRFCVVPLCWPQRFGALERLRSMGMGWLLNAGGAFDEFTGGIQFLIEFRLVEGSGGVQPLIVC